jgi:hypothetical protein
LLPLLLVLPVLLQEVQPHWLAQCLKCWHNKKLLLLTVVHLVLLQGTAPLPHSGTPAAARKL